MKIITRTILSLGCAFSILSSLNAMENPFETEKAWWIARIENVIHILEGKKGTLIDGQEQSLVNCLQKLHGGMYNDILQQRTNTLKVTLTTIRQIQEDQKCFDSLEEPIVFFFIALKPLDQGNSIGQTLYSSIQRHLYNLKEDDFSKIADFKNEFIQAEEALLDNIIPKKPEIIEQDPDTSSSSEEAPKGQPYGDQNKQQAPDGQNGQGGQPSDSTSSEEEAPIKKSYDPNADSGPCAIQ